MYLRSLTISGFKTFAKPTEIHFPTPNESTKHIVAIVGPNGSGKSNVADAIRWVLGEQSPRMLRGRAGQDVIFSGSDGAKRSGMAEVTITFANVKELEGFEGGELTLTRRLYRDGESSYQVNGNEVRLSDIQMLLAQAQVGQKSYAIINQGSIDQVLLASPEERKSFFDDASGVKSLQLKRHQAHNKLLRTEENLQQIEQILEELTPHLATLKRFVRKLSEREAIEQKLKDASVRYWGTLWCGLGREESAVEARRGGRGAELVRARATERTTFEQVQTIEATLKQSEQAPKTVRLVEQDQYDATLLAQDQARQTLFQARTAIEVARASKVHAWSPLPLPSIIERVEQLRQTLDSLKREAKEGQVAAQALDEVLTQSSQLLERLRKPSPDAITIDPALQQALEQTQSASQKAEQAVTQAKVALEQASAAARMQAQQATKTVLDAQRALMHAREVVRDLERADQDDQIALARIATRRDAMRNEWSDYLSGELEAAIQNYQTTDISTDSAHAEMLSARRALEQIGGIDPEIAREYEETQARHALLEEQSADLIAALRDTRTLVRELDEQIADASAKAFHTINGHFLHYFQRLFGGGTASLKPVYASDLAEETKQEGDAPTPVSTVESDPIVGVDILATPPGKTSKAIALLSGGERALSSIALLCAVLRTTPAPFILLDEVDAALDEANTWRFAEIVKELGLHTQCLLITHNRATMEAADTLFGVSMAQDGISRLLSIQLSDIAQDSTTRR